MFVKVQAFQCRGKDVYLIMSPIIIEERKIISTTSAPKQLLQFDAQRASTVMMNDEVRIGYIIAIV